MAKVSHFPHLSPSEFECAINELSNQFSRLSKLDRLDWQHVGLASHPEGHYLIITRPLSRSESTSTHDDDDGEAAPSNEDEVEEADDERLHQPTTALPTIEYSIVLSPAYQIPVLYVAISDPLHRYPPSSSTLYNYIIPRHFRAQAEDAGVIGGVTVTDHPVTGNAVFFIHPCRTAEVLEASVRKEVVDEEGIGFLGYLLLWIGAMGGCVGLNIPIALARVDGSLRKEVPNSSVLSKDSAG